MNMQELSEQIEKYFLICVISCLTILPYLMIIGFMIMVYQKNRELILSMPDTIKNVALILLLFLLSNPIWVIIIIGSIFLYHYIKTLKDQTYIIKSYNKKRCNEGKTCG